MWSENLSKRPILRRLAPDVDAIYSMLIMTHPTQLYANTENLTLKARLQHSLIQDRLDLLTQLRNLILRCSRLALAGLDIVF